MVLVFVQYNGRTKPSCCKILVRNDGGWCAGFSDILTPPCAFDTATRSTILVMSDAAQRTTTRYTSPCCALLLSCICVGCAPAQPPARRAAAARAQRNCRCCPRGPGEGGWCCSFAAQPWTLPRSRYRLMARTSTAAPSTWSRPARSRRCCGCFLTLSGGWSSPK